MAILTAQLTVRVNGQSVTGFPATIRLTGPAVAGGAEARAPLTGATFASLFGFDNLTTALVGSESGPINVGLNGLSENSTAAIKPLATGFTGFINATAIDGDNTRLSGANDPRVCAILSGDRKVT